MLRTHFPVLPSVCAVLAYNVMICTDAENDADRTVDELLAALDDNRGWIPRVVLESALYCCNINDEDGKFWHPQVATFPGFIKKVLGTKYHFDRYYNRIIEKDGPQKKAS